MSEASMDRTDRVIANHEGEVWAAAEDLCRLCRDLERELAEKERFISDEIQKREEAQRQALHSLNACGSTAEAAHEILKDCQKLTDLLDRALKMMVQAGYGVVPVNGDHNNPIIAWMADARAAMEAK